MKAKSRNPFEYGRELLAEELVDREDELTEIDNTIRNRGKLFLIGPRRFGKTSLLAAAEERARRAGVVVLRLDAERYETLQLLARALLTGAARELEAPVDKVIALFREVAAALRPEVVIDGATGTVSISLGAETRERGDLPLLSDALDAIEALAARTGRETCVMLDEVQHIIIEHGQKAERLLRATVQRHRHVSYIFAGSSTRMLAAMTDDPNRPFFRLGARLFLGKIPREAFLDFLERGFTDSGFRIEQGACETILSLAEEVPYNVQRLANEAWERLRIEEEPFLHPRVVRAALERILRKEDPAYTQLWIGLTRNQKKIVKAVIETGGVNLLSTEVAQRFSMAPSSIQAALKGLETAHLIRLEEVAGERRYRLVDPFLATWIDMMQAA
ncbi:MAG: AAA family ATPase [Gemmatimonadota bacterium]